MSYQVSRLTTIHSWLEGWQIIKCHLPLDALAVPQLLHSSSSVSKGLWKRSYCEKVLLCTGLAPKDLGRWKCSVTVDRAKALCHTADYWDNVWISRGTEKRMILLFFACVYHGSRLSWLLFIISFTLGLQFDRTSPCNVKQNSKIDGGLQLY